MTPLHDLLEAWRDETLTQEQAAELNRILRESAEARHLFQKEARLHAVLHAAVAGAAMAEAATWPSKSVVHFFSLLRPPWLAAAAGLVLGAFCTSLAWAYTGARSLILSLPLLEPSVGGFEKTTGPIAKGFPETLETWSGDAAEVAMPGARKAAGGAQVLRFVRAAPDANTGDPRAGSCDVFHLIDLRPWRTKYAHGQAVLELSASFLDASSAGTSPRPRFGCQLAIFRGSPNEVRRNWPASKEEAIARAQDHFTATEATWLQWRPLTARVLLPPNADFALIRLLVRREGPRSATPAEFGEQYADAVTLTLKTRMDRPSDP